MNMEKWHRDQHTGTFMILPYDDGSGGKGARKTNRREHDEERELSVREYSLHFFNNNRSPITY